MAGTQDFDPQDPVSVTYGKWLPQRKPAQGKLGGLASYTVDLPVANAVVGYANPYSVPCLVQAVINVTTVKGSAGMIDIGVGATAATSSDVLADGLSINALGVPDNVVGDLWSVLGADQFLTLDLDAAAPNLRGTVTFLLIPLG